MHFAASGQMQIYPRGREVECFEGWDGFSWHSSDSYRSVLVQFDSCSSIRPSCSLPDFTKESFFNGSVSTSDLESESFWRDLYDANLSDIAEEDLCLSLEKSWILFGCAGTVCFGLRVPFPFSCRFPWPQDGCCIAGESPHSKIGHSWVGGFRILFVDPWHLISLRFGQGDALV